MSSIAFPCESEDATRRFAFALGEIARPELVVALVGDLGAGKTRFVQAAAEGLGVAPSLVNSPTFVLIQEYEGRLPVFHFDTYRLRDLDEFMELGADDYFSSNGVCFVEWADRVEEALPRDRLNVRLEVTGEDTRTLHVSAGGEISQHVLAQMVERLEADQRNQNSHQQEDPAAS